MSEDILSFYLFLDTNIFLDYVIPHRRINYACSDILVRAIGSGDYHAFTSDFVLSELLGELKKEREIHDHVDHIKKDVLSRSEIQKLVQIIEQVKKIPNLTIFSSPVDQLQVYETVKNACLETKDASILLAAIELKNKSKTPVYLVTRDDRFLVRGNKLFTVEHPCSFIKSCPSNCGSRIFCQYKK